MTTNPKLYLLLFRNTGEETHAHLSSEQRAELATRWNGWYDDLVLQGKAIEGQPLILQGRIVSGARGSRIVDGPFAEAKEAIGGYCKLLVESLDEATQIAQQHPGLEHGLEIEVREAVTTCHLGITASVSTQGSFGRLRHAASGSRVWSMDESDAPEAAMQTLPDGTLADQA